MPDARDRLGTMAGASDAEREKFAQSVADDAMATCPGTLKDRVEVAAATGMLLSYLPKRR